jgi:hypothetical protein
MMNANAFLQKGQNMLHLWQLFVLIRQGVDGIVEDLFNEFLLLS